MFDSCRRDIHYLRLSVTDLLQPALPVLYAGRREKYRSAKKC